MSGPFILPHLLTRSRRFLALMVLDLVKALIEAEKEAKQLRAKIKYLEKL